MSAIAVCDSATCCSTGGCGPAPAAIEVPFAPIGCCGRPRVAEIS